MFTVFLQLPNVNVQLAKMRDVLKMDLSAVVQKVSAGGREWP